MDGQMNIFDFPEYLPEEKKAAVPFEECMNPPVEEEIVFYKHMTGDDFIPYIVDTLLSNSLLETFVTPLIEQLKAVKDIHFDGAKEVYKIFENTLFKLTNTQFFKCNDEMFSIKKPNDNPPFSKSGVCTISHCGKDNKLVLANVFVVDIADEILERVGKTKSHTESICKFSNHTCNKEELWKVANTLDGITCNRVCCRQCDVRLCGARCNGSEEPLQPTLGKIICDHDHRALCNRYGPNNVQLNKAKADLPKGFSCSGCCYYCSEAPMHGGKCKWDCRYYKEKE